MNKLDTDTRVRIIAALVEGNSIRATCRLTGAAKGTVLKLLAEVGAACKAHHDATVRGIRAARVQADEVWAFCYAKDKNVPDSMRGHPGIGSVWTWVGMDADSKLVIAWHVGTRDAGCAHDFMLDIADRLVGRCQLTTDGHRAYLQAVENAFGEHNVDYAMLVKLYGEGERKGEARYSPCVCLGAKPQAVFGAPDKAHISTSFVERSNLTLRMSSRRFTRLTNAFSKKRDNLAHAVALHYTFFNFCRIHQTLRVTPAMQAGIADHVWSLEELVGLLH